MGKKKTHEEYVTELAIKNPYIEVIDAYVDAKTKIRHKCKIDGYIWFAKPNNILSGTGCPECSGNAKKTHEEYIKELLLINPNITVIGQYVSANTPILHKCLIDGYEWYSQPNNILNGKGCPNCAGVLKKTHEEYVKELSLVNPNIVVIEDYINAKTPILHKCKIHNIEWKVSPSNILQGKGCPQCGNEKIREKLIKKHKEFICELKQINSDIIVLDTYIDAKTPITFKCLKDGHEWKATPSNILNGTSCPKCANNIKKTHEEYVYEVLSINSNIEVLGQYINSNTPILHRCKKHNIEWTITPYDVLHGKGCQQCGNEKIGEKFRKSHEQYIEEIKIINPDICVIGTYVNTQTPILHKCLKDGYIWETTPSNILYGGCGCPQCNESSGERQIRQWLERHNIIYDFQKTFDNCRDIKLLPFDFYLPNFNVIIEYDHKQHFEPIKYFGGQKTFEYTQKHDKIKDEYCKNNGISLLRIPYFKNVEEELNNFLFI